MPINYGRGIARKAAYTKKCSCENPRWHGSHIEVNSRTDEITYVMDCNNCRAYWASKSKGMRKYFDMDAVGHHSLFGYGYDPKDKRTHREIFRELDEKRLELLEQVAQSREEAVQEAIKDAEKARNAAEKFKAEMEASE